MKFFLPNTFAIPPGSARAVNRGFRDEVAPSVREPDGQFPGRELGFLQGKIDDLLADSVGDPVPHPARIAVAILEAGLAKGQITVVPPVKCRLRDAQFAQGPPHTLMGMLHQTDDFKFL